MTQILLKLLMGIITLVQEMTTFCKQLTWILWYVLANMETHIGLQKLWKKVIYLLIALVMTKLDLQKFVKF